LYLLKWDTGATFAEKREVSMWGLIVASSICGLLFGWHFKPYALIPAVLAIAGIAYFLASKQGSAIGVLSFVLATVAIQLCYFLSVGVSIFMDNFKPAKAPSEEFL
jgi:ABC-type Fe3+-siderophore transport system permease subunit